MTRAEALKKPCPTCGADPDRPCRTTKGKRRHALHQDRRSRSPIRLINPIAGAYHVLDLGAEEINLIIQACRAFPQLQAYENKEGTHILIAAAPPTTRQINSFLKE